MLMPAQDSRIRQRWRQRWLRVHLWLGLSAGMLFVLLGLTGSALVFYREIDGWLNPQVMINRQALPEQSLQAILDAIHTAHPGRLRAWRIEIPPAVASNRAYTARYYFAEETAHKSFAPLLVTVNPYTLQVTDSRFWGETVMTFIYDLHYTLLLEKVGSTSLGVVGLLLLVSLMTGLYLWWPSRTGLRNALSIKSPASRIRLTYDIHKLSGVYGLLLSVVLVGTGVMLAKPEWFKPAIQWWSPLFSTPVLASNISNTALPTPITADFATQQAKRVLPHATLRWLETPDGATGVYKLRMQQPGEPSTRFPQSYVWLDQYSGQVLASRDALQRSGGDALLAWLHPLHNGEAFGLTGRWLAFVAGFIPLALFVTGFMRWRQKTRAHRVMQQRVADKG